jgi:hypothetical protein
MSDEDDDWTCTCGHELDDHDEWDGECRVVGCPCDSFDLVEEDEP